MDEKTALFDEEEEQAMGIIGGADSPTAIYIAGKSDKCDLDSMISNSIVAHYTRQPSDDPESEGQTFPIVAHEVLSSEAAGETTVSYAALLIQECEISQSGLSFDAGGKSGQIRTAARLTFQKEENGEYRLTEFQTPEKGWEAGEEERFKKDISLIFPEELLEKTLDLVRDGEGTLKGRCQEQIEEVNEMIKQAD